MSPREGMYYIGMISGMIAGVSAARVLGWHHLVGLLCGLAVGWPLGMMFEKMYSSMTSGRNSANPKRSASATCSNPACGWTGKPGFATTCPRCGQDLPG